MRAKHWAAGVAVGVCRLACALPLRGSIFLFHAPKEDRGALRHQIEALEKQWRAAVLANNVQAIGGMLADSYIGIGPDGTISTKAQDLARRSSGQERIEQFDVQDQRVRLYGSTAVVTSRVKLQGDYSGQPLLGDYRYTRVWSLQHGQWHVVSFEANRVHDSSERER